MHILGVIPARGGSKAIPHKNIASVGGRPLLAYTCEAALKSKSLTRVVLSTDDQAIAEVGRTCGVEVPFMRSAGTAADDSPMLAVLQETLARLKSTEGYQPDIVVLLQPTSPLRREEHIDGSLKTLLETGADSVVSVVEVPHQFNPVSLMREEAGRLVPWMAGPMVLRRQDKPVVYARNGPAVIAVRREVLIQQASLYGRDIRPYVMQARDSIDIDGPDDVLLAECLLKVASVGGAA